MEIKEIRKAFPGWPSEFDVAKNPIMWAELAQQYFCAAKVLNSESNKVRFIIHENNGSVLSNSDECKLSTLTPSIFCLSFSIELAIKALYIKQFASHTMKPNVDTDFSHHRISVLAAKLTHIELNKEEIELLKQIEGLVISGKYRVGKSSTDTKTTNVLPNFDDLFDIIEPLYNKLMNLACQSSSSDTTLKIVP
jgi:hypothetical protein